MRGSFISCLATLTFQVLKLSKWSLKSNFISIPMFEKIFRVLPNGPIRSQNFVLIIFPRKFGLISAQSFVYILIFVFALPEVTKCSQGENQDNKWDRISNDFQDPTDMCDVKFQLKKKTFLRDFDIHVKTTNDFNNKA